MQCFSWDCAYGHVVYSWEVFFRNLAITASLSALPVYECDILYTHTQANVTSVIALFGSIFNDILYRDVLVGGFVLLTSRLNQWVLWWWQCGGGSSAKLL
jgi:hypothetical protein